MADPVLNLDAITDLACKEAGWEWNGVTYKDTWSGVHVLVPTPRECMRPVIEAVAPSISEAATARIRQVWDDWGNRDQDTLDVLTMWEELRDALGIPANPAGAL